MSDGNLGENYIARTPHPIDQEIRRREDAAAEMWAPALLAREVRETERRGGAKPMTQKQTEQGSAAQQAAAATLDELAFAAARADSDLRVVVLEILRRASTTQTTDLLDRIASSDDSTWLAAIKSEAVAALAGLAELEDPNTTPATPKPPSPTPALAGRDRFEEFVPDREVVLVSGDGPAEIRSKVGDDAAGVRIRVTGPVGPIRIGGNHPTAISLGTPKGAQGVEIVGDGVDVSTIAGVVLDSSLGDVAGEIRFSQVGVTPQKRGDGSSMGDFSPVRALTHMHEAHVILDGVRLFAPTDWTSWEGLGFKWALFLKGGRLTVLDSTCSPGREHSYYGHNVDDAWVESYDNELREIMLPSGEVLAVGPGRTHLHGTARIRDDYPQGGPPASGRIVYRGCTATRTGWEGLLGKVTPAGELLEPTYGAGGGAAFTIAGHVGELARVESCRVEETFASALAVWADQSPKNKAPDNPEGFRCWMLGEDGSPIDPTREGMLESYHSTRRLELIDFQVGRRGSRPALLVAGVRDLILDREGITLAGERLELGSNDFRHDYQAGIGGLRLIEDAF